MLVSVLTQVVVVVALLFLIAIPVVIGFDGLHAALRNWRPRIRETMPVILVLVPILLINKFARQALVSISQEHGLRLGGFFYKLEGEFILVFQEIGTRTLTQYFSFVYIYGYAFVLVFPVVMYFTLRDTTTLRKLLGAYTLNYTIGVTLYVIVHAFGPRQYLGDDVQWMLYTFEPSYQYLTREINHYTNVFPSLHTALSATVMAFAIRTRSEFPAWTPVAVLLAVSVWISTMYLGIHWGIDVLGGLLLAYGSVRLSDHLIGRYDVDEHFDSLYRLLASLHSRLQALSGRLVERTRR